MEIFKCIIIIAYLGCLFDDSSSYDEDTDLSLRIHNLGHRFCIIRSDAEYLTKGINRLKEKYGNLPEKIATDGR